MLSGNGLGFNITSRLVSSLGGTIQVKSQKGVGTEVVTTVTLDNVPELHDGHNRDFFPIAEKGLMSQKSIGIFGTGSSPEEMALSLSLQKICRDWLEINHQLISPSDTSFGLCDYYIAPHALLQEVSLRHLATSSGVDERFFPPVIVICSSQRVAHAMSFAAQSQQNGAIVFEFISQPCGPRKLAKTLESCLSRHQQRLSFGLDKGEICNSRASTALPLPPNKFERSSFFSLQKMERDQPAAKSQPPNETRPDNVHATSKSDGRFSTKDETQHQQAFPASVLLVEDNDINLKLLVAYMKKLGCKYLTARNGQEALDCFMQHTADIAIILMGKLPTRTKVCSQSLAKKAN